MVNTISQLQKSKELLEMGHNIQTLKAFDKYMAVGLGYRAGCQTRQDYTDFFKGFFIKRRTSLI